MRTPINNGILQSDLDAAGAKVLSADLSEYAGTNVIWNAGRFDATAASRKFDVKTYGAVGDGVTDDTTAIQDALADIPATGGVLYFPAGQYKYSGSTLNLDRQITVEGDGAGIHFAENGWGVNGSLAITTIDFNSETLPLFEVTAHGCAFKNLGLRNSVTTPSAGCAILVSALGDRTRYENITVDGFYIDIDVQAGSAHTFDGCMIIGPVLYGIRLQNILIPDGGDHFINDCYIGTHLSRAATSAIRIESGGGPKIVNTKINTFLGANAWQNGIDLAVAAGVATSDLLICNCSIEAFTGSGIKGRLGAGSTWRNILITANQMFSFGGSEIAIDFDGAGGTATGLMITGNYSWSDGSSNPSISVANYAGVAIVGNGHTGYNGLVGIGGGVSYSPSATVPPGGTTGQSLKKLSNANYDVGWG